MKSNLKARVENKGRWSPAKTLFSQEGGWEITYTGFILILLCLFIMLSSFASMEQGKIFRFTKSFSTAVNILTGGLKFEPGKEVLNKSPDMVVKDSPLAQFTRDLRGVITGIQVEEEEGVEVIEKDGKVLIRISDNVLFPSGAADLTFEGPALLHRIAQLLKKTDFRLRIEGHTDNVPIRTARYPSNWELSTARAVNTLRYFNEQEGIPADRLSAVGLGEYHPLVANDTEAHRAKNRRVELVITFPEEKRQTDQGVSTPDPNVKTTGEKTPENKKPNPTTNPHAPVGHNEG